MKQPITTTENKYHLFEKNSKGDILILGSGKFYRAQKKRYSIYNEPYQQLYKEQVLAIIKNAPENIRSCFSVL